MALVGNIAGEALLVPDVLHNLVFAFPRNVMPCTLFCSAVVALGLTVLAGLVQNNSFGVMLLD